MGHSNFKGTLEEELAKEIEEGVASGARGKPGECVFLKPEKNVGKRKESLLFQMLLRVLVG